MWPNPQFLIFCAVWNTRLCVNWTKTSFSKAYKLWTSLNKTYGDRKHLKKSKTKLLTKQTNYINASSKYYLRLESLCNMFTFLDAYFNLHKTVKIWIYSLCLSNVLRDIYNFALSASMSVLRCILYLNYYSLRQIKSKTSHHVQLIGFYAFPVWWRK